MSDDGLFYRDGLAWTPFPRSTPAPASSSGPSSNQIADGVVSGFFKIIIALLLLPLAFATFIAVREASTGSLPYAGFAVLCLATCYAAVRVLWRRG